MDFISNLIKRPISMTFKESAAEPTTTTTTTAAADSERSEPPKKLATIAKNTSINKELADLLETATQDLNCTDGTNVKGTAYKNAASEELRKLIDITENINQVSVDDQLYNIEYMIEAQLMQQEQKQLQHQQRKQKTEHLVPALTEHLDFYTETELSALPTKARLSSPMQHNTAAVDAADDTSSTPPVIGANSAFETYSTINQFPIDPELEKDFLIDANVGAGAKKLTGLTEFDETQIPELTLNTNTIVGELKERATALSSTVITNENKVSELETGYTSDSEIFVECQSLNSEKYTAIEQSEFDAYSSALNEQHINNVLVNTTLEQVTGDDYALLPDGYKQEMPTATNLSYMYEPMDVDMSITMESAAVDQSQQANKCLHIDPVPETAASTGNNSPKVLTSGYVTSSEVLEDSEATSTTATVTSDRTDELTAISPTTVDMHADLTLNMTNSFGSLKSSNSSGHKSPASPTFPIKFVTDVKQFPRSPQTTPETDEMPFLEEAINAPKVHKISSAVANKTADAKVTESLVMTLPEPKTPTESVGMMTENVKIMTPTATVPMIRTEIKLIPPSPEQTVDNETAKLNETAAMYQHSSAENSSTDGMFNGTFNSNSKALGPELATIDNDKRRTFCLQNELEQQPEEIENRSRRTFSVEPSTEQNKMNTETEKKSRRTFCIEDLRAEQYEKPHNRRTFSMPNVQNGEDENICIDISAAGDGAWLQQQSANVNKSRLTFNVSNEVELNEDIEIMDIDNTLPLAETLPPTNNVTTSELNSVAIAMAMQSKAAERSTSPPIPTSQKRACSDEYLETTYVEQSSSSNLVTQQSNAIDATSVESSKCSPIPQLSHTVAHMEATFVERPKSLSSPDIVAQQSCTKVPFEEAFVESTKSSPSSFKEAQSSSDAALPSPSLPVHQLTETARSQIPSPPPPPLPKQRNQLAAADQASKLMLPPTSRDIMTMGILKRAPIHPAHSPNATMVLEEPKLSTKKQANINARDDDKDIVAENYHPEVLRDSNICMRPQSTSNSFSVLTVDPNNTDEEEFYDAEFQSSHNIILNPADFDYLLTKGNNNAPVDRNSLLLKFDPLLGLPVLPNQQEQLQQQRQEELLQLFGNQKQQPPLQRVLSPTIEENEHSSDSSFIANTAAEQQKQKCQLQHQQQQQRKSNICAKAVQQEIFKPIVDLTTKYAKMSVDVLDNDCNKTFENSNSQSEEKQHNYNKMDELEKKIKNEVFFNASVKSEDVERKLKDAEQREEALIKRITEKDKTISKMNGVIEAYEKAIAELISEKEQLSQNYERQLNEVRADRDSNYQHLTSLETTFSDLHVKYEKSKEMTSQLKVIEEALLNEKKQIMDNLRLQEQRYERMKSHAMQQLEIANKKLETLTKEHAVESTKLKALLKKEEISRASINEQLQQKTRENAELVKICDELINGQGS